jgi:hypothetical protein
VINRLKSLFRKLFGSKDHSEVHRDKNWIISISDVGTRQVSVVHKTLDGKICTTYVAKEPLLDRLKRRQK